MENVQDVGRKGAQETPRSLKVEELELGIQGGQGSWKSAGERAAENPRHQQRGPRVFSKSTHICEEKI